MTTRSSIRMKPYRHFFMARISRHPASSRGSKRGFNLRLRSASFLLLLIAAAPAVGPAGGTPKGGGSPSAPGRTTDAAQLTLEEQRFLELVNGERLRRGQRELTLNATLVEVARDHSREMADKDYFGHMSPTRSRRTPMERYLRALPQRPAFACVGENLYYNTYVNVEGGHQALMKSPAHRANILYRPFREAGVGIYKASDGEFWVTEMFLTNEE